MRILIVANHNTGSFTPFVSEQAEAINRAGVEVDFFGVHGKGILGYLSNRKALIAKIIEYRPDIIHAHYGLSGLLANLQRIVPVVTTYHGSDIHSKGRNLLFSRLSIWLSAYNVFVSPDLLSIAAYKGSKHCVLPCGIDTDTFVPMERLDARKMLGWKPDGKYVLFAGSFGNVVKNSPLAKTATAFVQGAELVELRGFSREQVNLAMNAANCLLMTSLREGSPQVVKEAMACGTPIVSVDVGDVKEVISGIEGCFIANYDANDIAGNLKQAFLFQGKTNGRQRIIERGLSNNAVTERILNIYDEVLNNNKSLS